MPQPVGFVLLFSDRKRNVNQSSKLCHFSADISRFILNFDHKHMLSQLPSSSWRPGGLWLWKALLHHSCNSCANKTACFNRSNGTARLPWPWHCPSGIVQQPPLFPMNILTKSAKELFPSLQAAQIASSSIFFLSLIHDVHAGTHWAANMLSPCHAIFWANLYC